MTVQHYYQGPFRKFLAFPSWIVVKLMPLPEGHPWKGKLTWKWWHEGATNLTLQYGLLLWMLTFFISVMSFTLLAKWIEQQ